MSLMHGPLTRCSPFGRILADLGVGNPGNAAWISCCLYCINTTVMSTVIVVGRWQMEMRAYCKLFHDYRCCFRVPWLCSCCFEFVFSISL